MKDKLFLMLNEIVSKERIQKNTETIHRLEGDESYCNYKASTDYCMQMLKESGFEQIERIVLPADGKTTYFDCIMPQAWETTGRSFIRLEDENLTMDERMIADSGKDPFNIGVWSAPTPEGGIDCEITDFRNTGKNAEAVRGKLVLLDGYSQAQYKFLALNGASGVIISDSKADEDYPDHCRWCNGIGYTGWYLTAEDKRIPIFSITPRRCAFLRKRLAQGKLLAHAEAKCRVYDGEIYTVTGIIPGETAEEITMVAHMYEPFLPDDAAGAAVIAEICRSLKTLVSQEKLPSFKKTLRIVLSMERYGYHQYFLNKERNKKTLMLFSFDSCCHFPGGKDQPQMKLRLSSMLQPTFMDLYLPELLRRNLPNRSFILENGNLSDDTFCSDDQIKIPSMWIHSANMRYHHNSGPAFMNADWDLAFDVTTVMGTLIGQLATGDRTAYRNIIRKCEKFAFKHWENQCTIIRHDLEKGNLTGCDAREKIIYHASKLLKQLYSVVVFSSCRLSRGIHLKMHRLCRTVIKDFNVSEEERELWGIQAVANCTIVTRLIPGTLMSMAHIPQSERHTVNIPDLLYMLFDGQRSVYEAMKLYEYEMDTVFTDQEFKIILEELPYLEKYGYVKIAKR